MRYLNFKKTDKIFLLLYVSILIFSSLGSINTFYKPTDIESTLPSNVGNDGIFTYTENGLKYFAEFLTKEKVDLMKKQIRITDSSKFSDQIINGMGTGAESLTEEALEKMVGQIMILNVIKDPKNPVDSKAASDFSSEIYFPPVRSQGGQGSCTSWASVYYSMGYLEAKDNGWDASSGNNAYLLSPAWSYNKLTDEGSGTHHIETGLLLEEWGAATWETIPYTDTDYTNWGDESAWRNAPLHRPLQFNWLSYLGDPTITTIKNLVEGGTPVTFNIDAGEYTPGFVDNYIISSDEYSSSTITHANCIVGFDDSITDDGDVGAFRVVNSWGDSWGDSGFYWLTYETLKEIGVLGDGAIQIGYYDDRIDYHPSLVATWEFSTCPTRMNDIVTLGVGPYGSPLNTLNPEYQEHTTALFPSFMALDISEFQSYYDSNNDVLFYLELGSSNTPGIISSFRIERDISGVLQEITPESPDVPKTTPGYVIGTFMTLEHDLTVNLEVPNNPEIDQTYIINATVTNTGSNVETFVDLFLYLDSGLVNSTTVSTLPVDASDTINYVWTPTEYKTYNFTAYAPPVLSETYLGNNIATELITISSLQNYTMTIDYEYTWIDASGGTELLLSDDGYSTQSLPFDFQFYNETFSTIYIGANGYLSFTDSSPGDFSNDPIPSGDSDNYYLIAPFWDDLLTNYAGGGGTIYVQSFGTYWVAEWLDIHHISGSTLLGSFQVVIYDTGEIKFNYDYIDYYSGYTCGLNLGVDIQYYNSYQGLNDLTDTFTILFTYGPPSHDLSVSLEYPSYCEIDNTYTINATVTNNGINDETGVDLFLYLDDALEDSITISSLPVGASDTINYMWTPTEYKTYNFTAYAPPVPDEFYIDNNIATELISLTVLFDGMYIDHIFTESGSSPSRFSYSYYSGSLFFETWNLTGLGSSTWYVDSQTRLMSGGSLFGDGEHTPAWILTNVTLDDKILIAVDGEGDHLFNVSSELIYDLPGFDLVEVWVLEDLTTPGGVAWYEKSTGILLNGTFYYSGGSNWYLFDFVDTNVEFTYAVPPGDFILSSNAGTPDKDGTFDLAWESAEGAQNYSVYEYFSYITEINGSLTLLIEGTEDLTLPLSDYSDGTYYFIVVANNTYGGTLSNCFEVVVEIGPPGDFILSSNAGTPDDNGAFDLTWTSAEAALNYSVYQYSSYITEINGSLTSLINETEDLTLPRSGYTDGTYYFIVVAHNAYGDTLSNCIEVVVQIPQPTPPGSFVLSSNAGTPDNNGAFDLTWTSAVGAVTYSVYEYSSYITEINGSLTLIVAGNTNLTVSLSGYSNGTYYFIAVAYNAIGNTLSNCIEVVVQIPPEPEPTPPGIPGYNLYVVISMIGIVSIILFKKRYKLSNN